MTAAKSGVKPDIDEYIKHRMVQRSAFLQYKVLLDDDGDRVWYEPTARQRKQEFIETTDWDFVSSNVERLPYLAYMLEKHTPKLKPKPAEDAELFTFARRSDWKERLDKPTLDAVAALLGDYEKCLTRICGCRTPIRRRRRQSDIERILYGRGQEELYDTDMLYAAFSGLELERVGELRRAIREQAWRKKVVQMQVPIFAPNTEAAWGLRFDACFGRNFSRKWLNALPESVIVRGRDKGRGVCRCKVEKILC